MSRARESRIKELKWALQDRILVLDGSMGVLLQGKGLTAADFGGPDLEGCNENSCARGRT